MMRSRPGRTRQHRNQRQKVAGLVRPRIVVPNREGAMARTEAEMSARWDAPRLADPLPNAMVEIVKDRPSASSHTTPCGRTLKALELSTYGLLVDGPLEGGSDL
jgi:hypothetical protein